jgi:hypothetical protein
VTSKLVDVLNYTPSETNRATIAANRGRDWVTEAINSPVGQIVIAVLEDSRLENLPGGEVPPRDWLGRLAKLLALKGDPRRHAIAVASEWLDWLHSLVPEWTERHLLSVLEENGDGDREAFWAGFLWNANLRGPALFLRLKSAMLTLVKEGGAPREGRAQSLASLILSGWITGITKGGDQLVSNAEFRDALLHGGDEFRAQVLWQIERGLDDEEDSHGDRLSRMAEFFQSVWPRERAVKNSAMSMRLCGVLLSNSKSFAGLFDVVLPLLTKVAQGIDLDLLALHTGDNIVNNHPGRLLQLLHVVLPDDVSDWPYDTGDVLERIAATDGRLLSDKRLQRLRRKWSAR